MASARGRAGVIEVLKFMLSQRDEPERADTVPSDLRLFNVKAVEAEESTGVAELDSDTSDESPAKSPSGRIMTLPHLTAEELLDLFPEDDDSGPSFDPGFGRPYRQARTGSKVGRSGSRLAAAENVQLHNLAQRLREGFAMPTRVYDPSETVILLDWDDTLFPTSHLKVVNAGLGDPRTWDTLPNDSEFAMPLYAFSQTLSSFLREARSHGLVGIVTLSQRPWVVNSAAKYLPWLDIGTVLDELQIPVVYARECLKQSVRCLPGLPDGTFEGGVNPWTLAKTFAMKKILKRLYGHRPWVNVLSIGDSVTERDALTNLLWEQADKSCCKTIKLMSDPTLEQLDSQLGLISNHLGSMARQDEDIDFALDESCLI